MGEFDPDKKKTEPVVWDFANGSRFIFYGPLDDGYRGSEHSKPWDPGADIPTEPAEKLVVMGSGGRRWESIDPKVVAAAKRIKRAIYAMADRDAGVDTSHLELDPADPNGPNWTVRTQRPYQGCLDGSHSFSWRSGLDSCRYCGEPRKSEETPDYEALGYMPTRAGYADLDEAAWVVSFATSGVVRNSQGYE